MLHDVEYGPVGVSDRGPLLSKGFHSVGKSLLKQIINLVYTSSLKRIQPSCLRSVLVVSTMREYGILQLNPY